MVVSIVILMSTNLKIILNLNKYFNRKIYRTAFGLLGRCAVRTLALLGRCAVGNMGDRRATAAWGFAPAMNENCSDSAPNSEAP